MYRDLYDKVMYQKDKHRIQSPTEPNAFETYKDGWNRLQDKRDFHYQRQLRSINMKAQKRMSEANSLRELKKNQRAMLIKKDLSEKEMQECTFSPRVNFSVQSL